MEDVYIPVNEGSNKKSSIKNGGNQQKEEKGLSYFEVNPFSKVMANSKVKPSQLERANS